MFDTSRGFPYPLPMTSIDSPLEERLLERFLRYVRIDTASNRHAKTSPSTPGQLELARMLAGELQELGLSGVELDEQGFLFASLPSNLPEEETRTPEIGLMAHLDTSDAAPGNNVNPQVHNSYDGAPIRLQDGVNLDPAEYPELSRYKGQTVITSDGTTLLGADDKAGVAEIMTALEVLVRHPDIGHGRVSIYFTPDEEQGSSMQRFPIHKVTARYCYTFDGGEEGTIEAECFEGYKAEVTFYGRSIHTGVARGKLVNAIEMAAKYLTMIPGAETPQATDGRYGFFFPLEISGTIERSFLEIYVRDFEETEVLRRLEVLRQIGRAVEAVFPRGRVEVKTQKQYANLRRFLQETPEVVGYLEEAIRRTGIEPVHRIIRGGTDGARLSELGVPTPNVFTGGQNYHSRQEWVAVPAMVRAVQTAVNLCALWGEHGDHSRAG
jgi:tripeptide aminopeptidase